MNKDGVLSAVMKCEMLIDQHDTSAGQRKKSESPTGIEPRTSRIHGKWNTTYSKAIRFTSPCNINNFDGIENLISYNGPLLKANLGKILFCL